MAVLEKRILAAALTVDMTLLFTACAADGSAVESGAGFAPSSAPAGWTDAEIDDVLQAEIPPDAYFNARGIYGNYHGGGNVLFRGVRTFLAVDRIENADEAAARRTSGCGH